MKDIKKTLKKQKRDLAKTFKRKYMGAKQPSNFKPGALISFKYDAIDVTKKFDKNPLVVSLGNPMDSKKDMMGINLHWLPVNQRVLLASLVVELLEKKNGKLEYTDVKPLLNKFKNNPILRRYKIRRISPKVIQMDTDVYLRAASIDFADWSQ